MRLTLQEAVANARSAGSARRLPGKDDARVRDGVVFSAIFPRFAFARQTSIFTIGSCFARSVEERLPDFRLPTLSFAAPPHERPGRPNGILNEYNPGTICQRVEYAAKRASFADLCIAPEGEGYIDLLLPDHVSAATQARLLERRAQVDRVYAELFRTQTVIVTLDLVEAWYDKETGLYLNRIPPGPVVLADRDRFEVHILDAGETQALLERMVAALEAMGVRNILLSISPVPLETTFSGKDCAVANAYSKAVLIVSAHRLRDLHEAVDYFPGYEIVTSAGPRSYEDDSVHVSDEVVDLVTGYMVEQYVR